MDEGLISIYLQCAYIVETSFLEQNREGARLQGILFQICYEYKVRRLNNILIIGNPRDTDIRQCTFPTITLCLCQVYIVRQTGRYSTGTCRMSGQTNAEINNGSCLRIQEPVRHVRGSVSQERSSLERHGRTKCAGLRFVCPQCQCALSSLGGLTDHVKHVHRKLTSYQCEHCGKGYSHRNNYLDHLATHIGIKIYICSICQQQFTLKCSLKTHMLRFHSKRN